MGAAEGAAVGLAGGAAASTFVENRTEQKDSSISTSLAIFHVLVERCAVVPAVRVATPAALHRGSYQSSDSINSLTCVLECACM